MLGEGRGVQVFRRFCHIGVYGTDICIELTLYLQLCTLNLFDNYYALEVHIGLRRDSAEEFHVDAKVLHINTSKLAFYHCQLLQWRGF